MALAFCSVAALSAQRYTYRHYGAQQGLTNLVIRCLLQDREGYLWVGTDNGVFRFDGNSFRGFYRTDGLPSQIILHLAESPNGELWVTTDNGIAKRNQDRFETVAIDGGTPAHQAGTGFDNLGRVYVIQSAGLARSNQKQTDFQLVAPGTITGLYVRGDHVWFARDGELFHLQQDQATAGVSQPEAIGTAAGLPKSSWVSITEDASGTFWVRSADRLFSRARDQARFVDRSAGVGHSSAWMARVRNNGGESSAAGVLVPTDTGLAQVNGQPNASSFATSIPIDERHGLPAESVRDALVTRDGSLWVGTFGGGLVRRLGGGNWVSWRRQDGLPHNTVWAMHRDRQGRMWVGTSGGLSQLAPDGTVKRTWTTREGLAGNRAEWIVDDPAGGIFVSTQPFGISRFGANGELVQTYGPSAGLQATHSALLAVDQQHHLWVTSLDQCYRSVAPVDNGQPLRFAPMQVPLLSAAAKFTGGLVADGAGSVWLGTTEGLLGYTNGTWRQISKRDGLLADAVSAVSEKDGEYWLRYVDALGLTRLRFTGNTMQRKHFATRDGLSSDAVFATAQDHQGRLWVTSDNGVDMLASGRWHHYGTADGLISGDCDDGALYVDGDAVWVGTSNGLSRYAMTTRPAERIAQPLLFSAESESRTWRPNQQPVLPYHQRWLRIHFGSLRFADESSLRFRFRLAGEESEWTETQDRSVYYAGLPAGTHTFELESANQEGVWTRSPSNLTFAILPPWWQSWWFLACSVVSVGLVVGTAWRIRIRLLLAQKAALEAQVADRTAQLQESYRKLEEIAFVDSLTLLANRRMFAHEFDRRLAHAARYGNRFGLLLIDLDRFKPINDCFGHDAGDAVLAETAARLRAAVREDDCVARLGGGELCSRLAAAIAHPILFKQLVLEIGMSIGAAIYPTDGTTQDGLHKAADVALYEAKKRTEGPCWKKAGQGLLQTHEEAPQPKGVQPIRNS